MRQITLPSLAAAAALSFVATHTLSFSAEPSLGERPVSGPAANEPRPGGTVVEEVKKEPTLFDRIWDLPTLYKNEDSHFLNKLRFVGRFQLDEYNLDSDLGHDQDWIVRRLRLGLKAEMFENHLTAHVEVDLDPQNDNPAYLRLTDAYLAWKFSDAIKLTVGKQSAKFTLDGSTSSTELLTIDRNNVANNLWFPTEYIPGVTLSGKISQWIYNVGVFSGGSASKEFGNFDAGVFGLASIGYDFGKKLGVKTALLRADYVCNQRDPESTFTRSLEQIGALVFVLDAGRWGFSGDVAAGRGYGSQGDLFGLDAMPWFNITDKLQIVGRYTYIHGDDPNSIRFSRYESFVTGGRGDEYNEVYAGLNYFIYGHKLKLQTGYAYTTMHDAANDGGKYAGWSLTTGLRISW